MENHDDLGRRLAGYLRPTRVPGADETWRRIAPQLAGRPARRAGPGQWWAVAAGLAVLVLAVFFFQHAAHREPTAPPAPAALSGSPAITSNGGTVATAAATASPAIGARVVGANVVSVEPPPPFTVWQPGNRLFGTNLIAYAYRFTTDRGNAVVNSTVNTRGDGKADAPAAIMAAEREALTRLADEEGPALVLVYAADSLILGNGATPPAPGPTRLFAVAQRPAAGRSLPPGEAAWFSGKPATFVRQEGSVTLSWLAYDTSFRLSTNQTPEQAVVFAESLKPTTLVAPNDFVPAPTPTLTIPVPAQPSTTRATPIPCPNTPASTLRPLICPTNPTAPAGQATFTDGDVRRQFVPEPGYVGPFVTATMPQLSTIEFLSAGEVGARLNRGMNRPDDQLLCLVTITGDFVLPPPDPGIPPVAYRNVLLILDARTGVLVATTGTLR